MATQPLFSSDTDIFSGADYDAARDCDRLKTQLERILWICLDGNWRTVQRLTLELRRSYPGGNFPENSVQAQLRNARKLGYQVERRRTKDGLYEYRVLAPTNLGTLPKETAGLLGVNRG